MATRTIPVLYRPPTDPTIPCHWCRIPRTDHDAQQWHDWADWHNWEPADMRPRTIVPPHAVPELIGFGEFYGVRFTPLGEDDDAYLVVGHVEQRRGLAAATRWARINYLQRYRDCRWLEIARLWAVFTVPVEDPADWHVDYVEAGASGAVAVTLVTGLEDLEDYVRPSRCPMCARVRATGREAHDGSPWYPEKPTTWVHECPCTGGLVGYTWPADERHTTATA